MRRVCLTIARFLWYRSSTSPLKLANSMAGTFGGQACGQSRGGELSLTRAVVFESAKVEFANGINRAFVFLLFFGCQGSSEEDANRPWTHDTVLDVGDGDCLIRATDSYVEYDFRFDEGENKVRLSVQEFRDKSKLVKVNEQRPGGWRTAFLRTPEKELLVIENLNGREPKSTRINGVQLDTSKYVGWINEALMAASSSCDTDFARILDP